MSIVMRTIIAIPTTAAPCAAILEQKKKTRHEIAACLVAINTRMAKEALLQYDRLR